MTDRRTAVSCRYLLCVALACTSLGVPVAAQDGPKPMPVALLSEGVAGVPGMGQEVRALRDAQIVVTRLPQPADLVSAMAEEGAAGLGTMLLALGGMMVWIAGRRR
jgi:hypothetical protein